MHNSLTAADTLLIDCDGVLWTGSHVFKNIPETLAYLQSINKKLIFVTNNSTHSRASYLLKMQKLLSINITVDDIFGSSYASAVYLKNILPIGKKVYVIGMRGICDELTSLDIPFINDVHASSEFVSDINQLALFPTDPSIGAVLVGMDLNINYSKLAKAYTYITQNNDCLFIATNNDSTLPFGKVLYPGTGSIVAALSNALGKEPIVIGKPNQTMLDVIIQKYHLDRDKTMMIGDRLDTDIAFGKMGGLKTLLVMSGVTSQLDLEQSNIQPDFVLGDLGEMLGCSITPEGDFS